MSDCSCYRYDPCCSTHGRDWFCMDCGQKNPASVKYCPNLVMGITGGKTIEEHIQSVVAKAIQPICDKWEKPSFIERGPWRYRLALAA